MEDFLAAPAKRGVTGWVRSLPLNTPTPLPDEFYKGRTARHMSINVNTSARTAGIGVTTRTIDGVLWVARVEK